MVRNEDIRKKLVIVGKKLAKESFVIAEGGNISARKGSSMYIKAKNISLVSAKPKDYVLVDLKTSRSMFGIPSSEKYMHIACYKRRKDIKAVLHLHSVFSTTVANSRIKLGPISYELLSCLGSFLCRAKYKPAGSKALGREIASIVKKANGILLPNHGLLVVGGDLDMAFKRAVAVERACQVLVFSKLLGLHRFLPKKEARRIISLYK